MGSTFSVDDLLSELYEDFRDQDGYFTAYELAQRWGVGVDRARMILRRARDTGWEIQVRRVLRESLDGRMLPVPAYRVVRPRGESEE